MVRDAPEFTIGLRFAQTRWALLTMRRTGSYGRKIALPMTCRAAIALSASFACSSG
jgi:hypothetical protein